MMLQILVISALLVVSAVVGTKSEQTCGYDYCPQTKEGMLNVHIVAHTHLDAGWIKTVDEYYYGSNRNSGSGAVQYTLDTVVDELVKNKQRRFIFVETAFFWRWWRSQNDIKRHVVRRLVWDGQLEFAGGGWVMNDEAATHYSALIDNMEHGFRLLNDSFGQCAVPKIGWQIDPFGHAKEQAALFAQMGFDGFLFARSDYQDFAKRKIDKTLGMVWKGDEQLGDAASIYTEILPNHYSPPGGFCFDVYCQDDPIMDDKRLKGYNVDQKVDDFIKAVQKYANWTDTNTVIVTMGDDFQYVDARWWFENLDKLIAYTNARHVNGSNVNVMYSTPACYVKALNSVPNKKWTVKTDDFFPYAVDPHAYWTGYYSSRPALKQYIHTSAEFLQVCKQLDMLARLGPLDQHNMNILREAVLLGQHHDAITGTSRQLVAYDYAQRLAEGVLECESTIDDALQQLITSKCGDVPGPKQLFCQLLNISQCAATENSPNVAITIYNPLSRSVSQYVRIPVVDGSYVVTTGGENGATVNAQLVPISNTTKNIPGRDSKATQELVFQVQLPPIGFAVYFIAKARATSPMTSEKFAVKSSITSLSELKDDQTFENQYISVVFDKSTGAIKQMTDKASNVQIPLKQTIAFYAGDAGDNSKPEFRASGAYIFRPNCTGQPDNTSACVQAIKFDSAPEIVTGPVVQEMRSNNDWANVVVRLYADSPEIEVEWTVGPIPFADGIGKEVVVRFDTGLKSSGTFFSDSNARQLLMRTRDQRPTYTLNLTEPISANYYPLNSYIGVSDGKSAFSVLVDRAYGGSSLADGQVEVMVHRRLLHDDAFGVSQALNETGIDGRGLVSRGILRASLLALPQTPQLRLRSQQINAPAALSFTIDMTAQQWTSNYPTNFTGLQKELLKQINLLTLQQWRANMILVRLEHMFKDGEDPQLSQTVQVDLRTLLTKFTVLHAQELSLGANMPVEQLAKRFKWQTAESQNINVRTRRMLVPDESQDESVSDKKPRGGLLVGDDLIITIKPMEIRTFQMQLDDHITSIN